jgi:hypothetical protein
MTAIFITFNILVARRIRQPSGFYFAAGADSETGKTPGHRSFVQNLKSAANKHAHNTNYFLIFIRVIRVHSRLI